jgi:hypothetical protein
MRSFTPASIRSEAALRARGLSFRARLILGICGLVLLTGATITWLAQRSARQSTDTSTDALFREASAHAGSEARAFPAVPIVFGRQVVQTTVVKIINKNAGGCGCSGCGTQL